MLDIKCLQDIVSLQKIRNDAQAIVADPIGVQTQLIYGVNLACVRRQEAEQCDAADVSKAVVSESQSLVLRETSRENSIGELARTRGETGCACNLRISSFTPTPASKSSI